MAAVAHASRLATRPATPATPPAEHPGAQLGRPWRARRPSVPPPATHQLIDTSRWPDEPAEPATIDPDKFREALAYLCGKPEAAVPADEILAAAHEAGVDAFLLAALVHERSRCEPKRRTRAGIGLLGLDRRLYDSPGAPGPKPEATIHLDEWTPANLLSARANLSLGARLLRMWEEQHDAIDLAFGGVSHRSAVSHFFWGDVVTSSGTEDLALTARRRLLTRYEGTSPTPTTSELGVALVPPLESAPRVATSGPGDDRDGGARQHRGLDVVAALGEPVHAIADGTVIFAGVNLANNPRQNVPPAKIARFANRAMGAGGIYLCIRHTPAVAPKSGLVSCYMHLSRYFVALNAAVKAGDLIAIVGRTGVRRSPPHLHFEVRLDGAYKDPWQYFSESIIPPQETLTHVYNARAHRARLRTMGSRAPVASRSPKS